MMKPKSLLMSTFFASAVLWPGLAASQQVIESEVAGAPAFVIPEVTKADSVTSEPAEDPMLEKIRQEIAEKYADQDPVDGARLGALIDGSYLDDYKLDDLGDPVHFSNSIFDTSSRPSVVPEPPKAPEPAKQDPAEAFALFLSTPNGIRALSSMNGDQIEAIAMMMEMMRNPGAKTAAPRQQAAQEALLNGIPALGSSDLNKMEPEDLVRMAMDSVKPTEVNLGNGKDMYLSTWKAGQDADGTFYLVNAHLPGSQIGIMVGDVVGEFGRVISAEVDVQRGALVTFETGDKIAEREAPNLNDGIPAIQQPGGFPGDSLAGEIIVSTSTPGEETIEKEEEAESKPAEEVKRDTTATEFAPEKAIRPMPRPEELEKDKKADSPKSKSQKDK